MTENFAHLIAKNKVYDWIIKRGLFDLFINDLKMVKQEVNIPGTTYRVDIGIFDNLTLIFAIEIVNKHDVDTKKHEILKNLMFGYMKIYPWAVLQRSEKTTELWGIYYNSFIPEKGIKLYFPFKDSKVYNDFLKRIKEDIY